MLEVMNAGVADTMRGAVEAFVGPAIHLGRNRISSMVHAFYGGPGRGAADTARVISRNAVLTSRLLAVANTVHRGAGIAATSLDAATVRMGEDRVKSLAIVYEAGQSLFATAGTAGDFPAFWSQCIARGCLARAMAMNIDPRIAGHAFLVGALQDVGIPLLGMSDPIDYDEILRRSEGSQMRLAVLEWQSFNLNHIHVGLELLKGWDLPELIVDAVGRHHTNPPAGATSDTAVRLWQIGYIVGALPVGCETTADASYATLQRLIGTALNLSGQALTRLMRQAAAEYEDVADLFRPYAPATHSASDLLGASARVLGVIGPIESPETRSAPPEQFRNDRAERNADANQPTFLTTVL